MQAIQVLVESEINNISTSFLSPESYALTFLTAALIAVSSIAFAILLIRSARNQNGRTKEMRIPNK
jgi:hypothetical protein